MPEFDTQYERGAAALLIELENSTITVVHGEDTATVLAQARVRKGAWSEMYAAITDVMQNYKID